MVTKQQTNNRKMAPVRKRCLLLVLEQQVSFSPEIEDIMLMIIGMSCAYHLAQHPDKFEVTLIDAVDYCGGQAFSIPIDKEKHKASWLNQGVQGGSYIFHHTLTMFSRIGYHADPVELQVSGVLVFQCCS